MHRTGKEYNMELQIDALTKRYGKMLALDRFSAVFTEGICGVIGPNGSGKSTLMKLLTDNLTPDGGKILWNGHPTPEQKREYLSRIGYMPQESALYPQLTVAEFLAYMAEVKGVKREAAKKQIPDLLEITSLTEAANKRISALSGGMRQRACLAQALLGDPKLLLLDEPTAGLDPSQRVALRNALSEYSLGRITLLATHVIGDVEGLASTILLMKKGRVFAHESPAALVGRLRGRVFSVSVPSSLIPEWKSRYRILAIRATESDVILRLLSDVPPPGAEEVSPTLEDAFFQMNSLPE